MSRKPLLCVFIRGLPGSGKSSLAKAISTKFKATVLNPDYLSQSINLGDFKKARLKILKYRYLLNICVEK